MVNIFHTEVTDPCHAIFHFRPFDCREYRDFFSDRAGRICDNSPRSLTNLLVSFTGQCISQIKMSFQYFAPYSALKMISSFRGFSRYGLGFFLIEKEYFRVLDRKENHFGAASSRVLWWL